MISWIPHSTFQMPKGNQRPGYGCWVTVSHKFIGRGSQEIRQANRRAASSPSGGGVS